MGTSPVISTAEFPAYIRKMGVQLPHGAPNICGGDATGRHPRLRIGVFCRFESCSPHQSCIILGMIRYAPANVPMRPSIARVLSQGTPPKVPDGDHTVPTGKWLLNVGLLLGGFALGYLGIYNHKKPLGILAMQAGGSIVGASLVLLAMDAAYPQNPESMPTRA